jgi:hypothetical protein
MTSSGFDLSFVGVVGWTGAEERVDIGKNLGETGKEYSAQGKRDGGFLGEKTPTPFLISNIKFT